MLNDKIVECSDTIDQANDSILRVNSLIDNAQTEAWADYDSMGYALEGLEPAPAVINDCQAPKN